MMESHPPSKSSSASFVAQWLEETEGIEIRDVYEWGQEQDETLWTRRYELCLTDSILLVGAHWDYDGRWSDPREVGRIELVDEGYRVRSGSDSVSAKHVAEINVIEKDGKILVGSHGDWPIELPTNPEIQDPCGSLRSLIQRLASKDHDEQGTRSVQDLDLQLVEEAPTVVIDAANIARDQRHPWGSGGRGHGRVEPLRHVRERILERGYFPVFVYDASLRRDESMNLTALDEEVAPRPPHFKAPSSEDADIYILEFLADHHRSSGSEQGGFAVTNDRFEEYRGRYPDLALDDVLATVRWVATTPSILMGDRPIPKAGPSLLSRYR